MISFQTPPDLVLTRGLAIHQNPAAPPQGVITQAVKKIDFAGKNGFFTDASMGSKRAAALTES